MLAGTLDLLHPLGLLQRMNATLGQMRQPDDRVHRRPYLVAHIGQENTFGLIGGVGFFCPMCEFLLHVLKQYFLFLALPVVDHDAAGLKK